MHPGAHEANLVHQLDSGRGANESPESSSRHCITQKKEARKARPGESTLGDVRIRLEPESEQLTSWS
jgi:hypothetical protein